MVAMPKKFNPRAFERAVAEVVAAHLLDKHKLPTPDEIAALASGAALEGLARLETYASDTARYAEKAQLEQLPFKDFADLHVLVPKKGTHDTVAYPLLSDHFFDEQFFNDFPNIAAVRKYLTDQGIGIDGLASVKYQGDLRGVRYDRRAELAQLVYRCGLEPLPGMMEFEMDGPKADEWDKKHLRKLLAQIFSPQARGMVNDLLHKGTGDTAYLYDATPITRNMIRAHLMIAGQTDAPLANALARRNTGSQVAAHLTFLLFFQEVGLRNGTPYMKPRPPMQWGLDAPQARAKPA